MSDAILGAIIGVACGGLCAPVYTCSVYCATWLMMRLTRNHTSILVITHLLATTVVACGMLLTVLARNYVSVWATFRTTWALGFCVGALMYALIARRLMTR